MSQPPETPETITAGGAILARLKVVGVDYIFANSGTDFPPIIEGLAEAAAKDIPLPRAIVIPHEHAAMGMAHGYYLATGRAQAVMAPHECGAGKLCDSGPSIWRRSTYRCCCFRAGRRRWSKGGSGLVQCPIGWGQEMRDQTALVREATKWD